MDEVPVSPVDLHAVEPSVSGSEGRVPKGSDDPPDGWLV